MSSPTEVKSAYIFSNKVMVALMDGTFERVTYEAQKCKNQCPKELVEFKWGNKTFTIDETKVYRKDNAGPSLDKSDAVGFTKTVVRRPKH